MILLDASALVAFLDDEPGADKVAVALAEDTGGLSVVNLAEVLEIGARRGHGVPREQVDCLRERLAIVSVTEEDAVTAAELYAQTRKPALLLADRLALPMARHLSVAVLTAERAWADVPGIAVQVIR